MNWIKGDFLIITINWPHSESMVPEWYRLAMIGSSSFLYFQWKLTIMADEALFKQWIEYRERGITLVGKVVYAY